MAKNTKKEEQKNEINLEEIKEDLKGYVDVKVKEYYKDEVEKIYKKNLREKTKKIIRKDIVIIILLVIVVFLLYALYNNRFFHQFFIEEKQDTNNNSEVIITPTNNEKEKEEDLIKKYSYLLDNIRISKSSPYIQTYYKGLINEIKNYIALETVNFNSLDVDEDYSLIDSKVVETAYNNLFIGTYEKTNFKYLNNELKYIKKMDAYLSEKPLKKAEDYISRNIISVKEEDNKIIFVSNENTKKIVYTFINGKLSNIVEN